MLSPVSFVIPVLNGAATISGCLTSIECLSYPQELIEIIVVDNGSTDSTCAIVKNFRNVKLISEPKVGRSHARNTGWKVAKYDLIAFIDCDVTLEKQWLRFILKQFQSAKVACAQGKITPVPLNAKSTLFERFRIFNKKGNTQNTMIETVGMHELFPIINTASCVYRKGVLQELNGFDTTFARAEDIDLSMRASWSGYLISYNDMALSYVFWDKGGFYSYLKREISHAYHFIKLKRKFYSQRDGFLNNLGKLKRIILSILYTGGEFPLVLIRLFFKSASIIAYLVYDLVIKLEPGSVKYISKSIFKVTFENHNRHLIGRKIIAMQRKIKNPLAVTSISSHPETRIVISNDQVLLRNNLNKKNLVFGNEQFYFLRSFILDDDYYLNLVGEESYQSMATTLLPHLLTSMFFVEELDPSKLCLNPFIVFNRLINEDNEEEGFLISGGRTYRGNQETRLTKDISNLHPIINYLQKQLSKEDWHDSISEDLSPEMLVWLCEQEIITDQSFFINFLEKSFDLDSFLNEKEDFKNNKIKSLPKSFEVSATLLSQLKGEKKKNDIFKSHLKQFNNLISLSESIYWVEPWSFHHWMPIYITNELKSKLLNFDLNDWNESEIKDLLDSGVLTSSELQEMPIDIGLLSEQFKTTQAFYAPQATSSYLTWSMGRYLLSYFKTNIVKVGDIQCADRRSVYDSPLCLHVQDGMAKLINKILPFKIKSSFNYSVCYYQHADLYPHKDRKEAPYSMSYTLAAYEGKNRSDYKSTLGLEDDSGKKTEITLSDGDIALFNGYELTHYRHPIGPNKSLYVVVMHFVKADYTGDLG